MTKENMGEVEKYMKEDREKEEEENEGEQKRHGKKIRQGE